MSKQEQYIQLREQYPLFVYEGYKIVSEGAQETEEPDFDWVTAKSVFIRYSFAVYDKQGKKAFEFHPEWRIPSRSFYGEKPVPSPLWRNLCFQLGMAELVSYWKATASPKVKILCPTDVRMDEAAIGFWKKLYFNGLGEYFYLNGITATQTDFMNVEVEPVDLMTDATGCVRATASVVASCADATGRVPTPSSLPTMPLSPQVIVPIGGGKDSVVTWEILSYAHAHAQLPEAKNLLPLILNPRGATLACCAVGSKSENDIAVMNRSLDPLLLKLNEQGFLNGHTPFSALLAFASLLVAALSGRQYIALSNESSANESTVAGSSVNHQYSKSFEFETDFREYVCQYISPSFYYFSFLRPLSELYIARVFSECKPYHAVFKSCNVGSKQDVWCGHCAKCLFAYIIFSPFLPQAELEQIFGRNMFADATLWPLLQELDGETAVKPFECVGTVDEVNWALQQMRPLLQAATPGTYPLLEAYFASKAAQRPLSDQIWRQLYEPHALPPAFLSALKQYLSDKAC